MARITWKEGKVVSIETRNGIFVLAQMLKEPYIRFYNVFNDSIDKWIINDLIQVETLFTTAVAKQFLKASNILELKKIEADKNKIESDIWIKHFIGSRTVSLWKGAENERTFMVLGSRPGGSLVKKDLWWTPTEEQRVRKHISGVIDEMILDEIPLEDSKQIVQYELTNIRVYAELNERLYLCYKMKKNVDPLKDIVFNRPLQHEYKTYVDIISGSIHEEEWKQL